MADASPRPSRLAPLAVVAAIVALAVAATVLFRSDEVSDPPTAAGVTDGDLAPDLALPLFDGTSLRLSDLRGQPVVVNFFASWCAACVGELPDIAAVHAELGDRVAFLGVANVDERQAAIDLAERSGVAFGLADDPDGALLDAFGGIAMPTTVIVDADGRVVARASGAITAGALRSTLAPLITDQPQE